MIIRIMAMIIRQEESVIVRSISSLVGRFSNSHKIGKDKIKEISRENTGVGGIEILNELLPYEFIF